jgi:hypothetical protein
LLSPQAKGDDMEPVTVIAIIGGIALLAAFAGGGGITIKDFVLPALGTMPRVACGLVGVLLLGIVIWIEWPRPVSPAVEIIPTAQATRPPLRHGLAKLSGSATC